MRRANCFEAAEPSVDYVSLYSRTRNCLISKERSKKLTLSSFICSSVYDISFSSLPSPPFVFFQYLFLLSETLTSHVHSYACLESVLFNCNVKCWLWSRSLPQNYELVEKNACGLDGRGRTWRPMTYSCQQAWGFSRHIPPFSSDSSICVFVFILYTKGQ